MKTNTLHITNGSSVTSYLKELNYTGEFLTWHEMLCEGPTNFSIQSEAFRENRKTFLNKFYNLNAEDYYLTSEIAKLDKTESFLEIVLWFEYDLFCHINLLAAINLLQEKKIKAPIKLVCSGRIPEENELKGLCDLSPEQLDNHYKNRITLTNKDIDIALTVWQIYCGKDHNLLKPFITKKSAFQYLGCCLKAHLNRFPDSVNGLNTLEKNILLLLHKYEIKSKHHLLGYALNYQGYYGFGDLQLARIIEKLSIFYTQENNRVKLNRKGHEALLNHHNFASEINDNMIFGNVERIHFQFNKKENKLVKTTLYAH